MARIRWPGRLVLIVVLAGLVVMVAVALGFLGREVAYTDDAVDIVFIPPTK
jgi:hypothetical protein